MTDDEVIDLLSIITAYDKRTTGQGEFLAWSDAAQRERWTFTEAQDAVKAHYAESTQWLMPAHVTQRIRSNRSEPPRANTLPAATPQTATEQHRRNVLDWCAERVGRTRKPDPADVRRAGRIACPYCGAQPDRPCRQTWRGTPLDSGKHLSEPHAQRVTAARETEE